MSKLEYENVSKQFLTTRGKSVVALKDFNLTVEAGEFVCLLGKSGCGKTTVLRMTAGLDSSTSGLITLNGKGITDPDPKVGIVFQEDRLFPWRTIQRNVEFGLELAGVNRQGRTEKALHYLDLVGLSGFANSHPHELSGGMKQRASIARALVNEPEILLMDEPFGALDAQTRQQMQEELMRICANEQRTVMFVTHSVDEAVFLGDKVVVLTPSPGRIAEIVEIDAPRPRDRTAPEVIQYVRRIMAYF
ncbi:ABC transporter related (plasmid) [Xanthobacter versatilis]|uniref:ABC transporter related n=1 Tax=Xanthobacter autotrophicus (strain ATCC BAA-1158 / Py2) TaxID=78245 RepID=A7IQG4_XANP2|nr:ABC transporter related [Xanthobacter autotrophicus Py2]